MTRIKQWVDHLSVKKNLIFYGYLILTLVLIIICLALLLKNYNDVIADRQKNDEASVSTLAESLGILQSDIKDFSTYICINNDIHNLLTANESEVQEKNKNAKLWLEEAPMAIVQDMMSLKGHIKTIAIYPENGIRPYLRCMDAGAYVDDIDAIRSTETYKETLKAKNGMVWRYVPKGKSDTYQTNRFNKLVLYREIFDLTQKKTLGYIVIGVSSEYFENVCQNTLKNEKERVLVLDQNGNHLVQTGKIDGKLDEYLSSDEFLQQNYKERKTHFQYGDYEVYCRQMEKNSSIVCRIVPIYSLQMQFRDIAYMPLLLLIGMMIGLLPLLAIISNLVTKPLRQLCTAIDQFSTGDFEQQVEVTTHDEVGEVAECFNRMVLAIKELIDKNYVITLQEKESELAALQAQINPHFLYNTLDSLYWQATDAGNDDIAESILALSDLFRLVLSQGKREVTVEQEMQLVSCYLQIQKMRFTKRLNYEIHVDDSIKNAVIPKLILQPFVENAIVHGFENVSTPCLLTVTGQLEDGKIWFEIKDTGSGMTQEQIEKLWQEEPVQYRKQRIGRYAIKNIRERLQRKYQDKFSLQIESRVNEGTTVTLIIPYEKAREWENENINCR